MKKLIPSILISGSVITPEFLYAGSGNASDGLIFVVVMISILSLAFIILQLIDYFKNHGRRILQRMINLPGTFRQHLLGLYKRIHRKKSQDRCSGVIMQA